MHTSIKNLDDFHGFQEIKSEMCESKITSEACVKCYLFPSLEFKASNLSFNSSIILSILRIFFYF